jgi:hypothetical protein
VIDIVSVARSDKCLLMIILCRIITTSASWLTMPVNWVSALFLRSRYCYSMPTIQHSCQFIIIIGRWLQCRVQKGCLFQDHWSCPDRGRWERHEGNCHCCPHQRGDHSYQRRNCITWSAVQRCCDQ